MRIIIEAALAALATAANGGGVPDKASAPVHAAPATPDAVIAAARAAGVVGEQADGYLGFAKPPTPEIKAAVEAANAKRRTTYTDIAAKPGSGATVQDVASARGCEMLATNVATGEAYRLAPDLAWQTRGAGPIPLAAVCG